MSQQNNETTRCQAITNLIESVADQQKALARILSNKEDKPHQSYSARCQGGGSEPEKDNDDDQIDLINAITRLEFLLTAKLFLFADCACPNEGCENDD